VTEGLKIVGLGGSMAQVSRSRAALRLALEGAARAGAETELLDKVIGLISAAGGTQGLQAINTMEFAVRALRGWAVPYVVPVAAAARRAR
jgi:NAD(P)H-dependent FMN reductase